MNFIIEVSARHVHVSKEDLEKLFGEGYELTFIKELSQPGQFLSGEKVTVKKGNLEMGQVSILGPTRSESQVEFTITDCYKIKAKPYLRQSGDISDTESVTLIGTKGSIELSKGLIVAKRHIHITPEDAKIFNVRDEQIVNVKVDSNGRKIIFDDVVVRVSDKYALAMHVDTDEANAAMIPKDGCMGTIVNLFE